MTTPASARRTLVKIDQPVAYFTLENCTSEYWLVGAAVSNEIHLKQLPSNLSAYDLRTYRRWTSGLYLSYLAAIIVAIAFTFTNRPASELRASNEIQMARLKGSSESIDVPATARPVAKP
jgi:hypothetical protein